MAITLNDATKATEELAAVAAALSRSTVQVRSRRFGVGSGVIWHSSGLIITNDHVVRGPGATVELADGRVFDAVCTRRDPQLDLAALTVSAADLSAATVGDSDALRVGELVLAVGNPLGHVGVLTSGIVHAIGPKNALSRWIEADVRLAPGNSGGPLADAQGRVIGINSAIAGGLALAVPSNAVDRFLRLEEGERLYLGVTIQPVLVPLENKRVFGLLVLEVRQSRLAESAGLLTGDVLIGAAGQLFNTPQDLLKALLQVNPGDMLQLDFTRGGKRMTCVVRLKSGGTGVEAA
jgi:serine protease Do